MEKFVTGAFVDFLVPLFDSLLKTEYDNDKRNCQFINIVKETVRVFFKYKVDQLELANTMLENYLNQ